VLIGNTTKNQTPLLLFKPNLDTQALSPGVIRGKYPSQYFLSPPNYIAPRKNLF